MVTFRTVGGVEGFTALMARDEPVPAIPAHPVPGSAADSPFGTSMEWRSLRGRVAQVVAGARVSGSNAMVTIFASPRYGRTPAGTTTGVPAASFRSALRSWEVGDEDIVVLGSDMVGAVVADWHPDGLANFVEAMSLRAGTPAFIWGASLYPTDGDDTDDLIGAAVARLGLAQADDAPELAAIPSQGTAGRALFAVLGAAALGAGVLVPVTMSSGPPSPIAPSTSARHLADGTNRMGSPPSVGTSSPEQAGAASASQSSSSSGPAQSTGSLLGSVGGSVPGLVPAPAGGNVAGPATSSPNADPPASPPGSGLLPGGSGSSGVSAASTPTTTLVPTTIATTPTTTTTTTTPPSPTTTTTTTVPARSGGGCFLIFCG